MIMSWIQSKVLQGMKILFHMRKGIHIFYLLCMKDSGTMFQIYICSIMCCGSRDA
jgi:hypothetical protein